ncbi:(d)CMP kinase [Lentibacillus halophilus]
MEAKGIRVAIDGPAAAGKSTVAKIVAEKSSFIYIDTGAMYRALTWKVLQNRISPEDSQSIVDLLAKTDIDLEQGKSGQRVRVDGDDVTEAIRTEQVTGSVSHIAKHPNVREQMVQRQRKLANKHDIVMDGRDIGTHVIPNAEVKVFLKASVEERARRRYDENMQKGLTTDFETLKNEIEERDRIDSNRETAPLVKADDAIALDTTDLTIDDVASSILEKVNQAIINEGGSG